MRAHRRRLSPASLALDGGADGVHLQPHALRENMWQIDDRQHITERDRLRLAVSLFWRLGGENALFNSKPHDGCVVLEEHFEAAEALALIARERGTIVDGTQNMARTLCDQPDRVRCSLEPARRGGHRAADPLERRRASVGRPLVGIDQRIVDPCPKT